MIEQAHVDQIRRPWSWTWGSDQHRSRSILPSERLSGRNIHRETGETYHKVFNPTSADKEEDYYQREDDKPETVKRRLMWTLLKVIHFLLIIVQKGWVHDIEGNHDINDVFKDIQKSPEHLNKNVLVTFAIPDNKWYNELVWLIIVTLCSEEWIEIFLRRYFCVAKTMWLKVEGVSRYDAECHVYGWTLKMADFSKHKIRKNYIRILSETCYSGDESVRFNTWTYTYRFLNNRKLEG